MNFFNLQQWKTLWNLGKDPKPHYFSVKSGLSSGSLPAVPRYAVHRQRSNPDTGSDTPDHRITVQREPQRRGGSLPSRNKRKSRSGPIPDFENKPNARSVTPNRHGHRYYEETTMPQHANGMVDTQAYVERPAGSSTPLESYGAQFSTDGKVNQPPVKLQPRLDEYSSDESLRPKYATVQKRSLVKSAPTKQTSGIEPSRYKSQSEKDLTISTEDHLGDTHSPFNKQTHVDDRPLTKEPLKSWDRNKNGCLSAFRTKSTEAINDRYKSPARRTQDELEQDLTKDNVSRTGNFNQALNMFKQLSEGSQDQQSFNSYGRSPPSSSGSRTYSTGHYNAPLRDRFNSQQNVAENSHKVNELYKSAAVLPSVDGLGVPEEYEDKSYSTKITTGGVAIQKRESLYTRANSSGLPENDGTDQSRGFRRFNASPARVIETTHSRSNGSNLALLDIGPTDHQRAPIGSMKSIDNLDDSDDERPVTSTPRQSGRKNRRPLTKSRESLHYRPERDEKDEWQQEDILIRRQAQNDFGFIILGGCDQQVRSKDEGVYVADVAPAGPAAKDGRLRVGDLILSANGVDFTKITHDDAKNVITSARDQLQLTVRRYVGKVHIIKVQLVKNGGRLGFAVTGGSNNEVRQGDPTIYIKKIFEDTVAARNDSIEVGDQLHSVNGINLINVPHDVAIDALKNASDPVSLVIAKTARINPLIFANERF